MIHPLCIPSITTQSFHPSFHPLPTGQCANIDTKPEIHWGHLPRCRPHHSMRSPPAVTSSGTVCISFSASQSHSGRKSPAINAVASTGLTPASHELVEATAALHRLGVHSYLVQFQFTNNTCLLANCRLRRKYAIRRQFDVVTANQAADRRFPILILVPRKTDQLKLRENKPFQRA